MFAISGLDGRSGPARGQQGDELMSRLLGVLAVCGLVVTFSVATAEEKDAPTIKEVMKKCMAGKGALCGKVASGKATDEEKKELLAAFEALCKATPPKGEADSWKDKTKALVEAAKKGDSKALKAAANCKACHDLHKGK